MNKKSDSFIIKLRTSKISSSTSRGWSRASESSATPGLPHYLGITSGARLGSLPVLNGNNLQSLGACSSWPTMGFNRYRTRPSRFTGAHPLEHEPKKDSWGLRWTPKSRTITGYKKNKKKKKKTNLIPDLDHRLIQWRYPSMGTTQPNLLRKLQNYVTVFICSNESCSLISPIHWSMQVWILNPRVRVASRFLDLRYQVLKSILDCDR